MWSAPVITDITNDEAEQIAAMRRVPKTKKRGGDVDWGNAFEEDRQLYVALLIKWQSLCRNCILHTVRDKNGSVPYKHRANIKTFDDDSLRGADTDEDAQGPAAGIDGIDQIKKPKQADYGETDDACFARANKDKPVYSADEFEPIGGFSLGFDSLISKIPDMIHSAARSFDSARGGWEAHLWRSVHHDVRTELRAESVAGTTKKEDKDNKEALPAALFVQVQLRVTLAVQAADRDVQGILNQERKYRHRDTDRAVLGLHWEQKKTLKQIGRKLKIEASTVRGHLARYRREIPSLRVAEKTTKLWTSYCKSTENKQSKASVELFSKLISILYGRTPKPDDARIMDMPDDLWGDIAPWFAERRTIRYRNGSDKDEDCAKAASPGRSVPFATGQVRPTLLSGLRSPSPRRMAKAVAKVRYDWWNINSRDNSFWEQSPTDNNFDRAWWAEAAREAESIEGGEIAASWDRAFSRLPRGPIKLDLVMVNFKPYRLRPDYPLKQVKRERKRGGYQRWSRK